jgi:hypothetical protein
MAATGSQQRPSTYGQIATSNGGGGAATSASRNWSDPRFQAFTLLRIAFTVAPIAFGLDKFFNVMVDWPTYLAPWVNDYDIALRDFGLMLGALTLGRLASVYDPQPPPLREDHLNPTGFDSFPTLAVKTRKGRA